MTAATAEVRDTLKQFREAVNMPASAIERWLKTEESREVGLKDEADDESVGHQSGRRIVRLLRKRNGDYSSADHAHMRKVVGYVHRHLAQRPSHTDAELEHTRWRYSLMNWGHDPIKPRGTSMSTAKKSASKKSAAKKSAAKKSASKSAGSKSASAKSAAKKSTGGKSTSSKPAAKKATAGKAAGRKTAAKKAAGGKSSSRKTASKKAAGRKTASKKTASKKTASKKTASKKASSSKTAAKKTSHKSTNGQAGTAFSPGDKVAWTTSQGETEGVVEKKLTGPMKIKQHQVSASPENPEYLVRSSKSGGKAAHKPGSLRKR